MLKLSGEEGVEERKSMGSALVDVFDAGVVLVKSEVKALTRQIGQVAKAKGLGLVLLLAAVGPLVMGLIFVILAVFYGLLSLGLTAWGAALIVALLSLVVTGALVVLGLKKLSTEVESAAPTVVVPRAPGSAIPAAQPAPPAPPVVRPSPVQQGPKPGEPVVLKDAPGLQVSTQPTFREDMKAIDLDKTPEVDRG